MTAKKKKKADVPSSSAMENPEVFQEQFGKFESYVNRNKTIVFSIVGILVLGVAGLFYYRTNQEKQNESAKRDMFQAEYYFQTDSLSLALNGDGNNFGFLEIIDEYKGTKVANLANFYAGTIYIKQGNFGQAITHLEEFSSDDLLIQARAFSLIGDAYMELEDYQNAATSYTKAADYKPNKYFTPQYLMKAALAYEKSSDLANAKKMYDRIVSDFYDSNLYQDAQKQSARIGGLIAS